MAFLDRFKSAFSTQEDAPEMTTPSASEYVEWLPRYMLRHSYTELEINSTQPLPGVDEAPCTPPQKAVLNRLKVMCGLNPFRFAEPVEGRFEKAHANHTLHFSSRFQDSDQQSTCTLNLSIRA